MPSWPRYPFLYEINTWVWISELTRTRNKCVDLSCIDPAEWDAIAALGFDAVWLMGVWERSPWGIEIANGNASLRDDFKRALPDFTLADNVGSPYCVRRFEVDAHLGGSKGLAIARRELADRGVKLILDFVPNHVAPDHPWVRDCPEFFIRGNPADMRNQPGSFLKIGDQIFARARDPYFPPWPDVLQLNAFQSGLREASLETVLSIAGQCDGVRCDMSMLLLNAIFKQTWGERAGQSPNSEYWQEIIPKVKNAFDQFLFIAEAYWDLEWELQKQGFDFCYDKRLYDRLKDGSAADVRGHLSADLAFQNKLLRFIENHDEPRAAAAFAAQRLPAVAITTATLPGARLFHQGQLEGRRVRLPVFLGREPEEALDEECSSFYRKLLTALNRAIFRNGEWMLCACSGWPDNATYRNLVPWAWTDDESHYLVVVNFSQDAAQGRIHLPWRDVQGKSWRLHDPISDVTYERQGDEMAALGLYVDLSAFQFHLFQFMAV